MNKQDVLSVLESIDNPLMEESYISLKAVNSVEVDNGLTTVRD